MNDQALPRSEAELVRSAVFSDVGEKSSNKDLRNVALCYTLQS
jgi:hypothetical protein